ncbi:MAG: hypothetical protein MZW92_57995 [Comamonadaceae bacterium]|nr:hypothetical protein [Comamonadaceae bacterium]
MRCTSTTCPERRQPGTRPARAWLHARDGAVRAGGARRCSAPRITQISPCASTWARPPRSSQARALQSARAGLEWAGVPGAAQPGTAGRRAGLLRHHQLQRGGARRLHRHRELHAHAGQRHGERRRTDLAFYRLVANACNAPSGGACPAGGTPGTTYVERQLTWTVMR